MVSLRAIRVFEAAARRLSMSEAARELFVSQGAVSQQIRNLEHQLGVTLFTRHRTGLTMTSAGERLFKALGPPMRDIARAVDDFQRQAELREVAISTVPSVAARWLLPRLAELESALKTRLRLEISRELVDFHQRNVDVAIRYAEHGAWQDAHATLLFPLDIICVSAGNLSLVGQGTAEAIRQSDLRLLDDSHHAYWEKCAELIGLDDSVIGQRRLLIDDLNIVIDVTLKGEGIALVPRFLIESELRAGQLVKLGDFERTLSGGYWIVTPKGRMPESVDRLKRLLLELAWRETG